MHPILLTGKHCLTTDVKITWLNFINYLKVCNYTMYNYLFLTLLYIMIIHTCLLSLFIKKNHKKTKANLAKIKNTDCYICP